MLDGTLPIGSPGIGPGIGWGLCTVPWVLFSVAIGGGAGSSTLPWRYVLNLCQLSTLLTVSYIIHSIDWFTRWSVGPATALVHHAVVAVAACSAWQYWVSVHWSMPALLAVHELFFGYLVGLLCYLPRSFSIGEALTIANALALLTADFGFYGLAQTRLQPVMGTVDVASRSTLLIVVQGGIVASCLHGLAIGLARKAFYPAIVGHRTPPGALRWMDAAVYAIATGAVVLLMAYYLHALLGTSVFAWGWSFLWRDPWYGPFLCYWAACLVGTVWYVGWRMPAGTPMASRAARNLRRKVYHGLVVLMFVPGYIYVPRLLSLGLAVAWCGMVAVELMRPFDLGPWVFGVLQFIQSFADDHDAGPAVLSHLYLLLGCAVPLWLGLIHPLGSLAGVLTLGIGDAVASVVGQRWGHHPWLWGRKTVEGTVGFVVSVLVAWRGLLPWLPGPSTNHWSWTVTSVCVTALVEALTDQNDNLFAPLVLASLVNLGTYQPRP
ncbi:dolichol kinase [Dimargaris verticillata]|uniref:dolichol kinase n=1 Tax=Dimargaris verticillata TaxID=2761393 RepID=A0A9W8ECQ2_9FUNG|nr:dolichol kinase [Dimargaris verticillata]